MRQLKMGVLLFLYVLLAACSGSQVKGNGKITQKERIVNAFTTIRAVGNFVIQVNYDQSKPSVFVQTDENLQSYVLSTVQDDTLQLSIAKGFNIQPTQPILVTVNAKSLVSALVRGQSTFRLNNLSGNSFKLILADGSKGSVAGELAAAFFVLKDTTSVNAMDLKAEYVNVSIEGDGKATVNVTDKLNVYINGAGAVTYFGNPPKINQEIYKGGQLIKGTQP